MNSKTQAKLRNITLKCLLLSFLSLASELTVICLKFHSYALAWRVATAIGILAFSSILFLIAKSLIDKTDQRVAISKILWSHLADEHPTVSLFLWFRNILLPFGMVLGIGCIAQALSADYDLVIANKSLFAFSITWEAKLLDLAGPAAYASLAFASLFLLLKLALTVFVSRRWQHALRWSNNAQTSIQLLHKLTTLALFTKNLDEANEYSLRLLELTECTPSYETAIVVGRSALPLKVAVSVMLAPVALTFVLIIFGASHGLVDATSIAILLPSAVLFGLLTLAANTKNLYPWQARAAELFDESPCGAKLSADQAKVARGLSNRNGTLLGQCLTCILVPTLASALISVFDSRSGWPIHLPLALILEVPIILICAVAVTYILEVFLYSYAKSEAITKSAFSAGPVFITCLIAAVSTLFLPALQITLSYRSLPEAVDDIDTIRFIVRELTTPVVIPLLLSCLAVVFARTGKLALILRVGSVLFTSFCLVLFMYCYSNPWITYVCRADLKNITGPVNEVVDDCTSAIRINPKAARAYSKRGNAYADLGEEEKALSDFSTSIALFPKQPKVYFSRAEIYYDRGDYQQAVADSSRAILLQPRFLYFLQRAEALNCLHEYGKAIADCDKAVELRPKSSYGYIFRADNYAKCWQFDRAFADLNRAIAINPRVPRIYSVRADAYERMGQSKLAEKERQRATELSKVW